MMVGLIFDAATIILSSIMFIYAINRLNRNANYFIYFIFFVIMVLPLYLDYTIGKPDYHSWPLGCKNYGFIVSYDDELTRIIYDLLILIVQSSLLLFKTNFVNKISLLDSLSPRSLRAFRRLLGVIALLPIILTFLLPLNNEMLFSWGWRDASLFTFDQGMYFKVEKLSYLGLAASLLLLYLNRYKQMKLINLLWLACLYMNACLEAKRSILIFAASILLALVVGKASKKDLFKILIFVGIIGALIVLLSVYIKTQYRGYGSSGFTAIYGNLRVDYFRDDTTKMLIYSLLHPGDIKVLSYPLQSYISQIGYIFPLDFLSVDRLGYNTYFTCALIREPLSSGLSYTTTSMIDEMIANFGILALFIIPAVVLAFANLADRLPLELKALVCSCFVLLMMYSLNYIMWYLEVSLALIVIYRHSKKKRRKESAK